MDSARGTEVPIERARNEPYGEEIGTPDGAGDSLPETDITVDSSVLTVQLDCVSEPVEK